MLNTFGRWVATTPFESRGIEAEVRSGFASIKNKVSLKELKVLVGNEKISAGSSVFVRADMFKMEWALRLFDAEGLSFILVPEEQIVLVKETETK